MDLSLWVVIILALKMIIYIGTAAAIGGVFIALKVVKDTRLNSTVSDYCILLVMSALVANLVYFFIQVGYFAEVGLSGMWDVTIIPLLWDSGIGEATLSRVIGFILALIVCFGTKKRAILQPGLLRSILVIVYLFCIFNLARSYSQMGHVAALSFPLSLLLSLHIIFVAWWIGALWPLWKACHLLPLISLHRLMKQFGNMAIIAVSLLVVCGLIVAYELNHPLTNLINNAYGQGFLLKLSLVGLMLLIAARHKYQLVPALIIKELALPEQTVQEGTIQERITPRLAKMKLANSIKFELLLAVIIILITSVISTLFGPSH